MAGLMSVLRSSFGLRLHQKYIYYGTYQELENRVARISSANVERLKDSTYKFKPDISLGTLVIKGSPNAVDGINVIMSIDKLSTNEQIILFTTKIRPEHYLTTVLLLFFSIVSYFERDTDKFLSFTNLLLFGVVMYMWFHLLFRFQEQRVVNNVAKELSLTEAIT
jgi:hypothetical protein